MVSTAAADCAGGTENGKQSDAPASASAPASYPPPTPPATPRPVGTACLTAAEQAAVVRFPSRSGAYLAGVLLGTGRAGAVLAHQSSSDLCDWMPYARTLAARGVRALAVDLNGFGGSTASPGSPSDPRWDLDVTAAAGVLRARGTPEVVLVGASLGGTAALTAAADLQPPAAGVVNLSGPAQISGLDAAGAAARLAVPSLLVVSTDDQYAADVGKVSAATPARYRRLERVPGTSHGVALLDNALNRDANRVRALIDTFIQTHTAPGTR